MQRPSKRALRFVRVLLGGGEAAGGPDGMFRAESGGRLVGLEAAEVRTLIADGVLAGDPHSCRAGEGARSWVRRQLAEGDGFVEQHGRFVRSPEAGLINVNESPLARLATAAGGAEAFLAWHHVEAGERVRKLAARAQLQPRLTMSYSLAHTAGGRWQAGSAAELSDMAAEARKALRELWAVLPRDCAEIILDVCGLEKGLQLIETERGWPRRSAKLVLRIGLDQLAQHWGLAPVAVGETSRKQRAWLDEGARPSVFG